MRTKEKLAQALREAGFDDLVDRAAAGEFDDSESSYAMPQTALVGELTRYAIRPERRQAVRAFVARVRGGEFDGTKEDVEAWVASLPPDERKEMEAGLRALDRAAANKMGPK